MAVASHTHVSLFYRLLEKDAHFTTQISSSNLRQSLSNSSASGSSSPTSQDQPGSKDSLRDMPPAATPTETTPSQQHVSETAQKVATPTKDEPQSPNTHSTSDVPPVETAPTAPPSETPPPTLLPEGPSRDLESPVEVRSKPTSSAYSPNPYVAAISEGEESEAEEEEEEEEGLGPEVTVVTGDDSRIPYHVVRGGRGPY